MHVFEGADELRAAVGRHLGHSDWTTVGREGVDRYTAATGDVPADGTIPAFLVLALVNRFLPEVVDVRGFALGVNYGVDGARFPAPALVGARLRGGVELAGVEGVRGGVQATWRVTVECEGGAERAAVVSAVARYLA